MLSTKFCLLKNACNPKLRLFWALQEVLFTSKAVFYRHISDFKEMSSYNKTQNVQLCHNLMHLHIKLSKFPKILPPQISKLQQC